MNPELRAALRNNFPSFVRRGFRTLKPGTRLDGDLYIDYICHEIEKVAKGETKRLVVNLPPRHSKTHIGSICLSAWVLAHEPSTSIMVVTNSEDLCRDIAYAIRSLIRSNWYQQCFQTRIADDRSQVTDFVTTQGGSVYAVSIGGAITGRGADIIIVDDPLHIDDALDIRKLESVNKFFDTVILSRLNHPKNGRVVVIAHRLHQNDLSGHILERGGWNHVMLPMIAPDTVSYPIGNEKWHRRKGEPLRPDGFDPEDIERLRADTDAPDFDTLYQQDPSGGFIGRLDRDCFPSFARLPEANLPVVLSIDPGQRGGPANSFSVIQAWCRNGSDHFLIDQWREQCTYRDLRSAFWRFWRTYGPSAVLIETTGQGPALISDVARKARAQLVEIVPDHRSKIYRFRDHINVFCGRRIWHPAEAPWSGDYISELVEFPCGDFDDQVDATIQYLEFMREDPPLASRSPRVLGAMANSRGLFIASPASLTTPGVQNCPGAVLRRYSDET